MEHYLVGLSAETQLFYTQVAQCAQLPLEQVLSDVVQAGRRAEPGGPGQNRAGINGRCRGILHLPFILPVFCLSTYSTVALRIRFPTW